MSNLKFVLDTNIWLSAYMNGRCSGLDRETACLCIKKASANGLIIMNAATGRDLQNVLKKFVDLNEITKEHGQMIYETAKKQCVMVRLEPGYTQKNFEALKQKCKDGDDWPFLAIADTHAAFALVSNDKKDLANGIPYKNIKILTPQAFLLERLIR